MRMALKLGKLDAICARLKKTSAVDVVATTQNGITVNKSINKHCNEANVQTEATINNNNEDTVTDLNESPLPGPIAGQEAKTAETLETKPVPVSPLPLFKPCSTSSAGRRKRRKNSQPRNVLKLEEDFDSDVEEARESFAKQFKAESTESSLEGKSIETNGLNDAQPRYMGQGRPIPQSGNHQYFLQQQNECVGDFLCTSDDQNKLEKNFPLDLSTCKSSVNSFSKSTKQKFTGTIASTFFQEADHTPSTTVFTTKSPSPTPLSGDGHHTQARVLADYAENTMNELLSIYGFEGSGVDRVDKGKILKQKQLLSISAQKSLTSRAESSLPASSVPRKTPSPSPPPSGDISNGQALLEDAAITANSLSSNEETPTTSDDKPSNKPNKKDSLLKLKLHSLKASVKQGGTLQKHLTSDYAKYIKKFHNGNECEGSHCKDLGYRDHYHCLDCNFKVFIKKEEMVRHYKWHKKRDESLQHGFMRYSPLDDCSTKFGSCTHNRRQTHYHCVQAGCDKVYISTSDVQMHANYHRKDSAIIQEGFQRFRATEDCGTTKCNFYGQRTTHFHCRRPNCNFTFKNKADMEKHKSYHQKDEILGKDGFKKFMKYEHCSYNGCRFSKISNHIHCIRAGCTYVLHSTAQLYSHKRKHERREFENIYRTFKQAQRNPGLQSQPCGTQLVSTVTSLPLNMQLASQSVLTSIPIQAIGEAVIASGLVSKQMVQHVALPLKVAAASTPVLPHPVNSSQSAAVFSTASPPAAYSAAAISTPMIVKTDDEVLKSKDDACGTNTFTSVNVKLEPKSDSESDIEDGVPTIKIENSSPESLLERSVLDLKQARLQDSVNLSVSRKTSSSELEQEQEKGNQIIGKASSDSSCGVEVNDTKTPNLQMVLPKVKKVGAPEKRDRDESWKNYLIRYVSHLLVDHNTYMVQCCFSRTQNGGSNVFRVSKSISRNMSHLTADQNTYMVQRYTANDPCNSRCALLYKDHYHCKITGCQVLFKSKDGVREHAKFHDLQDRVTPLMYGKYDSEEPCPETCQYNLKETHYHCKWSGCTHAITEAGPTFGRLEHYRIHEYAKAAAGKTYRMPSSLNNSTADDILAQRRRGRPPKYPRVDVPLVPKVELSETEIKESSISTAVSEAIDGKSKVINGFRRFEASEPCPDDQCMYYMQVHYHCGRPRCHTATDRIDVLNLHAKDFHSFVSILENFEFFDRNVNCRRVHCHNNGANRHYHCTRPRCDYSFVRHSTMSQHDRKHTSGSSSSGSKTVVPTLSTPRLTPIQLVRHPDGQTYIPIVSALDPQNKNVVKASGTFYPLSTVAGLPATAVTLTPAPLAVATSGVQQLGTSSLTFTIPANLVTATIPVMAQTLPTASTSTSIVPVIAAGSVVTQAGSVASITNRPLTVLLQQKSGKEISQPSWSSMRNSMHYSLQASCGRPFCKLKKKDHFHCLECNQAFSDPARLRGHISKHGVRFKKLVQDPRAIRPLPVAIVKAAQSTSEMGLDLSTGKGKQELPAEPCTSALGEEETASKKKGGGEEEEIDQEEDSEGPAHLDKPPLNLVSTGGTSSPVATIFDASEERPLVLEEELEDCDDETSWLDNESLDGKEQETASETLSSVDTSFDGTDQSATTSPCSSRRSVRKKMLTKHEDYMDSDDSALARQMKLKLNAPIPSTSSRVNKQIPDGFIRFHCSSDCGHQRCAYRQTVTHYHCLRSECGYGFSDKSRIIQHRVRHERIDQLMGEDFQQFRATVSCSHPNCVFAEKSSHFHCRKCPFMCADSSKVLAHRKYHAKLDNISNNGFQKFTGSEDCHIPTCTYFCKQTHYHCTYKGCNHAVLGPAQMAPHKLKHACRDV